MQPVVVQRGVARVSWARASVWLRERCTDRIVGRLRVWIADLRQPRDERLGRADSGPSLIDMD